MGSQTATLGIPTLQQWLRDTELKGFLKTRSSLLKDVDKSIKAYNDPGGRTPENVGAIRVALTKWIESKGDGWETNERNAPPRKPVSALFDLVTALKAKLPKEEQDALRSLVDQQKTLLYRNFSTARLAIAGFAAAGDLRFAKDKVQEAARAAGSAPKSMAASVLSPETMKLVNEMFGSQIHQAQAFVQWIVQETGTQVLAEAAHSVLDMLPVISVVAGAAKVLSQGAATLYSLYPMATTAYHAKGVAQGAPSVAVDAMMSILRRELANNATKTAITTAGFAANTALHAAKGVGAVVAPAVGAATTAAQAARVVTMFALQVREAVLMHKALKSPQTIGFDTLRQCPLLGCYLLLGASDSELLAITWSEFGQAGWMNEVTDALKHLKPLMDTAADVIRRAPFKLDGVPLRRSVTPTALGRAKMMAGWS